MLQHTQNHASLVRLSPSFFSGVRAADLAGAPPFEEVQRRVAELMQGRLLVGHALQNDLEVGAATLGWTGRWAWVRVNADVPHPRRLPPLLTCCRRFSSATRGETCATPRATRR